MTGFPVQGSGREMGRNKSRSRSLVIPEGVRDGEDGMGFDFPS